MWGWWQTGDNLSTLCGEKERQGSDAAFFSPFFSKRKISGPTRLDPWSEPPGGRELNTLTTTPNFPAVIDASGDTYTRESQIVLFLPLDGSATGPFRWTIPLRLIVHSAIVQKWWEENAGDTYVNFTWHDSFPVTAAYNSASIDGRAHGWHFSKQMKPASA